MACYGSIVVMTVFFWVAIWRIESYPEWFHEIAGGFFLSLLSTMVMTEIAFWVYLPRMQTLYELFLGTQYPIIPM